MLAEENPTTATSALSKSTLSDHLHDDVGQHLEAASNQPSASNAGLFGLAFWIMPVVFAVGGVASLGMFDKVGMTKEVECVV